MFQNSRELKGIADRFTIVDDNRDGRDIFKPRHKRENKNITEEIKKKAQTVTFINMTESSGASVVNTK